MRRTSSTGWPPPDESEPPAAAPDSTSRFTSRADAYVGSRPTYPSAFFDLLTDRLGMRPGHVVVDVGSGTGILASAFLARGQRVFGVEPNHAMRSRAEAALAGHPRFESVDGTAEETGLPGDVADFVVAGQSFHWFNPCRAAVELGRVLRPTGWAVVVWNLPAVGREPFTDAYVQFLRRWGRHYEGVTSRHADPSLLGEFFRDGTFDEDRFDNVQVLDREQWRGRIESSSYMPAPGQPGHPEMVRALADLFDTHKAEGRVRILYTAVAFWGRL